MAGTILEGETFLVLGGIAAHEGYLRLPLVFAAAFAGALIGDQTWYWVGRRHGRAFLERRPHWQARADRANRLLTRYGAAYSFGFRFLYGMRTVSPFVIGAAGLPPHPFVAMNVLGAAFWTVLYASLGYAFGSVATVLVHEIQRNQVRVLVAAATIGLGVWIYRRVRRSRLSSTGGS